MDETVTTAFTHAGREWIAERCVNEANTREFVRVRPASRRPRPTREEHRAAVVSYFARIPACGPGSVDNFESYEENP